MLGGSFHTFQHIFYFTCFVGLQFALVVGRGKQCTLTWGTLLLWAQSQEEEIDHNRSISKEPDTNTNVPTGFRFATRSLKTTFKHCTMKSTPWSKYWVCCHKEKIIINILKDIGLIDDYWCLSNLWLSRHKSVRLISGAGFCLDLWPPYQQLPDHFSFISWWVLLTHSLWGLTVNSVH